MDQYIGKLLDNRYEILERIGSGGMAVVYKALCHRLNRMVAIKILKADLAQDAEFRRRFHDESQAVAMLSHPNIVAVYDVSKSDSLDYIVMELIDGITLKQYMQKKGGPLSWKESLHFITQIMKGLSHAHSRGIIHRDIKPHNIMVLRDGSVKVADFGIARLVSAAQSTLTQEALGSVHYISPEQARGSHIDCRSDIYSAGVVLYEMLTGRLPYEGDSPVSVAIQHINSIPLSPREINPDIPPALELITTKAMASDVSKRYASADAMLADLEEFRKNPNISFEYTRDDLLSGSDEPTRVLEGSGSHNLKDALAAQERSEPRTQGTRRRRDEEEEDVRHRKRGRGAASSDRGSVVPALLAVAAILVFLAGIVYFLYNAIILPMITPADSYTVPTLTGKQIEEVQSDPEAYAPFTITVSREEVSDLPAGEIIDQEPDAGTSVRSGQLEITVTVSAGSNNFVMEDYYNRRYREVELLLRSEGIEAVREDVYDESVTEDYIVSQDVSAGTELLPGDKVTFKVSMGPEPKTSVVTLLVGFPREQAESIARDTLKLKPEITEVYDSTQPAGYVVYQSIPVDTEVEQGSTITLQVSLGPDPNVEPSQEPETTPPVTENPEPETTPPATSQEPTAEVAKSVRVDLPTGRTGTIQVRITVGGVTKYTSTIDATIPSPIYPTLTGKGSQLVEVYFDGSLAQSFVVEFS